MSHSKVKATGCRIKHYETLLYHFATCLTIYVLTRSCHVEVHNSFPKLLTLDVKLNYVVSYWNQCKTRKLWLGLYRIEHPPPPPPPPPPPHTHTHTRSHTQHTHTRVRAHTQSLLLYQWPAALDATLILAALAAVLSHWWVSYPQKTVCLWYFGVAIMTGPYNNQSDGSAQIANATRANVKRAIPGVINDIRKINHWGRYCKHPWKRIRLQKLLKDVGEAYALPEEDWNRFYEATNHGSDHQFICTLQLNVHLIDTVP